MIFNIPYNFVFLHCKLNDMRKLNYILLPLVILMFTACGRSATVTSFNIIPEPVFMVTKAGTYTLSSTPQLNYVNLGQNSSTAKHISKSLRRLHFVPTFGSKAEGGITLSINDSINSEIGEEGYLLEVRPTDGIFISANTEVGLFYGYQTFLQMLPEDINEVSYSNITLPECTILDYPRFSWRGCHLDVSRHFFSVAEVKKVLDVMAMYKMNHFHWHLTDDHGWRIESEKYPLLNEIGSWRVDRDDEPWGEATPPKEGERATYGGYYTKEEIKDVVEYAKCRNIEIIPEVDLPGHCCAILAAYPQYGCEDSAYSVQIGPYWPPKAILCAGNDSTIHFIEEVLGEVAELFPSRYIHVGGDEAYKDNWKVCPKCQERIKKENLRDEEDLQGWMMREIEEYMKVHGKTIMGWDEVLDGDVSKDVVVTAWRGQKYGMDAARNGHYTVMCPTKYCYFDYYQGDPKYQPVAIGGDNTLRNVYDFDPVPAGTNSYLVDYILGGQCNVWTEFINTSEHLEYMLLPRMCAVAECLWSSQNNKDWNNFRHKIEFHKKRLTSMGYNVCWGSFKPIMNATKVQGEKYRVSLETEVANTYLFYTIDGSEPTQESNIYLGPMVLDKGTVVKTISVYDGEQREGVYEYHL